MDHIGQLKKIINTSDLVKLNDSDFKTHIDNQIISYFTKSNIAYSIDEINQVSKYFFREFRGLSIIDYFLEDEEINEIMINSYNKIFLERQSEIQTSDLVFESRDHLERIIQKIVAETGREVNLSNPIVDSRLSDGSRVNIVLPPISDGQPCVTIRKFRKDNLKIPDLIGFASLNKDLADFLANLVKAKYNIIISGGTSSGKTTFLNALTEFMDDDERIITIEDSRELRVINKTNLISLETRNPNNSKRGQVTIKDLIKNSLRMRPDRIIVGEVRADETLDMMQAMQTGHDGSLTTAHANNPKDLISRLETMVLRASDNIPLEAVKRLIASSIEIIVQVSRVTRDRRCVVEISELVFDKGEVGVNTLYRFDYEKDDWIKINDLSRVDKLRRYLSGK